MSLKKKTVRIGDKDIVIKELSCEKQWELLDEEKNKRSKPYKFCLEDEKVLKELNSKEGVELMKAINELNGWKGEKVFQSPAQESGK